MSVILSCPLWRILGEISVLGQNKKRFLVKKDIIIFCKDTFFLNMTL